MLKHFAADGTVKQEFPGATNYQPVNRRVRVFGRAGVLAEIVLEEGEMVGEVFTKVHSTNQPEPSQYMRLKT